MKRLLLLLLCLVVVSFAGTLRAQAPSAGGNPFLNESKNNMEDLHNAIIKQPYTFLAGGFTMHLTFHSDGTGEEEDWKFKWHAKDAQTIELEELGKNKKPDGRKTTLTFSPDYTSYTGHHFDGVTVVSGKQVVK
jgi:hypothetical protein